MTSNLSREELEKKLCELQSQIDSLNLIYRSVVDNSLDAILLTIPDGRILAANKAATVLFQMSEQEIIKGGRDALVDPTDPRLPGALKERLLSGSFFGEINFKKADGTIFPAEVSSSIFKEADGQLRTSMIVRDISEQKKSEKTLRHSDELLRYIIDNASGSVAVFDRDMRYIYVSRKFLSDFKIGEKNVIGKNHYEIIPDLPQKFRDIHQRALAGETLHNCKDSLTREDGSQIWSSWSCLPWYEADGSTGGIVIYAEIITERVMVEEALRQSEQNYRTLFREMLNGFAQHEIICDPQGRPIDYRFLDINPAFERLTGLKAEEVIGKTALEIMPDLERYWIDIYGKVALTGQPALFENYSAPLGKHFEITSFCPKPGQFACIFSDISERKNSEQEKEKLQTQLLHAQKMESVGRLAGGVAHDFNNMLSVILGHAELMQKEIGNDAPLRSDLEEIIAAGNRSANLTRQLLAFARRQTISPETVDLNDAVDSMLKMLRRLIGENIDLVWRPKSGLWPVHIDSSQLDQLMANLCVNSRDAIQNVGQITIETDMKTLSASNRDGPTELPDGDYVTLSVCDNGCGMSGEIQSHIFEPFYTTKKVGEGTGLGLATVYGIVKQNNGSINVSSEPGKGTAVTVFLPRHLETALQKTRKPEIHKEKHGDETILLVEDENSLLKMTSTTLRHFGYNVFAAATPGEAREVLSSSREKIQLLITDVIMPEMNGRDLARELKKIRPGLKVLFMSGYTDEVIANHGVLDNNINFIEKPFTMNDLATKVRETLDK
ncbi:MAG: hypothetical protein A2W80_08240 [Candidatus Riflebacteria bacterium GWC2_50_8]|nr:MAG: hypothetical protein A2W80_08240 [Candidatus Riflebacteria bacterium GWC2_50_8]